MKSWVRDHLATTLRPPGDRKNQLFWKILFWPYLATGVVSGHKSGQVAFIGGHSDQPDHLFIRETLLSGQILAIKSPIIFLWHFTGTSRTFQFEKFVATP